MPIFTETQNPVKPGKFNIQVNKSAQRLVSQSLTLQIGKTLSMFIIQIAY